MFPPLERANCYSLRVEFRIFKEITLFMISPIFNEFAKKIVEIKKKEGFESVKFFDFTVEEK